MGKNKKNELDIYLFHKGKHRRAYEYMGAHKEKDGWVIRTWAPNAKSIHLVGDFNGWNGHMYPLKKINDEGIWEIKTKGLRKGDLYKLRVESQNGEIHDKADPYAFYSELRPNTASKLYDNKFKYSWNDSNWIEERESLYEKPVNIYEVHIGSWKRKKENEFLTYRELADELVEYLKEMNYTHIEVMPVNEYPLDDSWGYQPTGYYSVTSRYGKPEDFMYFIDKMHQAGIGVILDWVPSHFCKDSHGLYKFDGTPTYEYQSQILAENYDWGTANFDLGRNEVRSFLISNALFWLREFHIDGLRLDAVANMLYLDYGKNGHPDLKNIHGGNENLYAVEFLRDLNKAVKDEFPNALICAEESTAWTAVTGNPEHESLGFSCKWNMGWMNDILEYMKVNPLWKNEVHEKMTFSFMYAFAENYILPFSHDEVVHGKCSLINKMPGERWDKFANLRALMGFMMGHPGKKLNFMGNEIAQSLEWRFYEGLEWNVLELDENKKFQTYIKDLNKFYKEEKALWELDFNPRGIQWMNHYDRNGNTVIFTRRSHDIDDCLTIVVNFSGEYKKNYSVPIPRDGVYKEVFSSNDLKYGGTGLLNTGDLLSVHGNINIDLPSFTAIFLKREL
jgi:1,4-alpha-glucan branching enzyme